MKKEKEFTLVEIIVVIVMIGALLVLILPNMLEIKKSSDKTMVASKISAVELAGENYVQDNINEYVGCNNGNICTIKLEELEENDYLDKKTKEDLSGEVLVCYNMNTQEAKVKYVEKEEDLKCDGEEYYALNLEQNSMSVSYKDKLENQKVKIITSGEFKNITCSNSEIENPYKSNFKVTCSVKDNNLLISYQKGDTSVFPGYSNYETVRIKVRGETAKNEDKLEIFNLFIAKSEEEKPRYLAASPFSGINKDQIVKIVTVDSNKVPSNAKKVWDATASGGKPGSVMGWLVCSNESSCTSEGPYDLYLGQDGGVVANPNSSYLFSYFEKVTEIDLSHFDTSKVTDMSYMFNSTHSLTSLDLSLLDTSNVTNMQAMFFNSSALTSLDLSSFNTSKVTDMSIMFSHMFSLTSLDLSHFDTRNVKNMYQMFGGARSLANLNLSSFDTSNVTDMSYMFDRTYSLTSLDLSSFDMRNVTNANGMFSMEIAIEGEESYNEVYKFLELKTPKEMPSINIDLPKNIYLYTQNGEKYNKLNNSTPKSTWLKASWN